MSTFARPSTRCASRITTRLQALFTLAGLWALSGCTTLLPLDSPVATPVNQQLALSAGLRPMSMGEFLPNKPSVDPFTQEVTTEESLMREAQYLKDNLNVELKAAGLLNSGSHRVVSALVTDSQMRAGQGSLAARFTLVDARDGQVRYERELRVSATWAPALGNVGAQWTAKEHMALYRQLIGQLFADPAFRDATRG